MDPGAGHVEARARERVIGGKRRAQFVTKEGRRPRDRGGVDAGRVTGQPEVVDNQRLQWRVAGPLAKPEERAVRGRAAIEPGGHRVDLAPVKVIVAVPLEVLWFDPKGVGKELH